MIKSHKSDTEENKLTEKGKRIEISKNIRQNDKKHIKAKNIFQHV